MGASKIFEVLRTKLARMHRPVKKNKALYPPDVSTLGVDAVMEAPAGGTYLIE